MELILLAKDIEKIKDAWNYNNASSCGWAMNEFDRYANHVLRKNNLIIEPERKIKDLPDFFSWKNEDFILAQIPVFSRTHPNNGQIEIGNQLLKTIDIQYAEFKSPYISDKKHYVVNFIGTKARFSVDLGQITKGSVTKAEFTDLLEARFKFITYHTYDIYLITKDRTIKLTANRFELS